MNEAVLKKLRPVLVILGALLLGFEVFVCTREVMDLAERDFHWGWWSWTPCFFLVYLLIEVILSKNKAALVTSCVLMAVDLLADICILAGRRDQVWDAPYFVLVLIGMIVLLAVEDNSFLKKLNLLTLGISVIALFSIHL